MLIILVDSFVRGFLAIMLSTMYYIVLRMFKMLFEISQLFIIFLQRRRKRNYKDIKFLTTPYSKLILIANLHLFFIFRD